jgi:AcrR family transcriptional regulator
MTDADITTPIRRADAVRNREKLLTAAVDVFAQDGTDVSLERVAKRAGVGIGTLYRHFPTRDALVEAAYRNEVARLHEAAGELLAEHPPDEALALWMDHYVTYAVAKRGMRDALQSLTASNSELYAESRAQITEAIATLLEAGAAAGTIRADVDPRDVLLATGSIWNATEDPDWQDRARRLLALLMDGLRYGA